MNLNSYRDEVKDFLEKANFSDQGTASKLKWLEDEFQLLKDSVGANKADRIRHQIYDMLFLLFEISIDYDFDLESEWSIGRAKKRKKYLSGSAE